jgi:hypothetical protein
MAAALLCMGIATTTAAPYPTTTRRPASGIAEGELKALACATQAPKCSNEKQLDFLVRSLGLDLKGRTAVGKVTGVAARRGGGIILTATLFDENLPAVSWWAGRSADSCRVGLVELVIAIADQPILHRELEEHLARPPQTFNLSADQRRQKFPNHRLATVALRIERHCLFLQTVQLTHVKEKTMVKAIEKFIPGLLDIIDLR